MPIETQQARALVDISHGDIRIPCGTVYETDAKIIKNHVAAGIADDSNEAIAYALSENPGVIVLAVSGVEMAEAKEPPAGNKAPADDKAPVADQVKASNKQEASAP